MKTVKIKKFISGETLIEVLIAISVLIIVMVPSAALVMQSTRSTAYTRDNLIAMSLADEGIELMNNIRDANALKFGEKFDSCWDTKPDYNGKNDCEKNKIAQDGFYKISMDLSKKNFPIALTLMGGDFNKSAPSDKYKLKFNKESGLYNYDKGDDTNFWRVLKIKYSESKQSMYISSRIFFKNGTDLKEIARFKALTKTTK